MLKRNLHNKPDFINLHEYEQLFKENYRRLCLYAMQILKDKDTAEEIVQDTFVKLWEKHEDIQFKSSPVVYLQKAIKNNALSHLRYRNKKRVVDIDETHIDIKSSNDADSEANITEINRLIDQTLNEFPEKWQKIFRLIRFDGLKYKEAAKELSISVKTVEKAMGRILKAFKTKMNDYNYTMRIFLIFIFYLIIS
jgi:RNA polymerase sigma-70 factor (ECF subfamily)